MKRMHNPRGFAMLLVIIAVMMATILTTAYLASRDNSPAIGENVASAAAARWAAMSGVQIGAAVLETEEDWQDAGGVLLDHVDLAGADVTVEVMDMMTGEAPTVATQHLMMTSTAIVEGVTQVATATAQIMPSDKKVDVDMSEFAIFATDTIKLDTASTVTTWPAFALGRISEPLNVATTSTAAGAIQVRDTAATVNTRAFTVPGASASLVDAQSGPRVSKKSLPDPIPMPDPPGPGVLGPNRLLPPPDMTYTAPTTTVSADKRYRKVKVNANSTLNLNGPLTFVADEDFDADAQSKIYVSGNVKMVVFDDLKLSSASLEVKEGGRLELFVRHDMTLSNSYLGDERPDNSMPVDGSAPVNMNLERIQVWGITPTSTGRAWYFSGASVAKGSFYNPYELAQIRNTSALYGRIAAKQVYVTNSGAIYYDPRLNQNMGFTNPDSGMYDAGGRIKAPFRTLANLSDTTLLLVSTLTGTVLSAADNLVGTLLDPGPGAVAPTQPTPRTVPVEITIDSFGVDPTSWEDEG
jgi:hypothetical protein